MSMRPISRLATAALLSLAAAGAASAASAATGPFGDKPAGAQSLPGDNLPPFNMLDEHGRLKPMPHLEGPLHAAGGRPESAAEGPSLEAANRLALAAVHACARQGYRVGAPKARAAIALRMATNTWLPSEPSAVSMARASPAESTTAAPTR